jgi:predicted alpha/beta-fold hydrolase
MPIIAQSSYVPPIGFRNGHLQSLYPSLFRKVRGVRYHRERIWTPDDDFLDLDWSRVGGKQLAIISHGLEGSSQRWYILGMVRAVNRVGWDGLAWNMRGCSGEPNRTLRSYHSGATEDLHAVIQHVIDQEVYASIALIGFSQGRSDNYQGRRLLSAMRPGRRCRANGKIGEQSLYDSIPSHAA